MITSFTARRYRNVDCVDVPLGRVNVLLGPNNSGKSNFLKALTLPSEIARGQSGDAGRPPWTQAIEQRGGAAIVQRGTPFPGQVSLAYKMELPESRRLDYRVELTIPDPQKSHMTPLTAQEEFEWHPRAGTILRGKGGSDKLLQLELDQPSGHVVTIPSAQPISWLQSSSLVGLQLSLKLGATVTPLAMAGPEQLQAVFRRVYEYNCGDFDLPQARGAVASFADLRNLDPVATQLANALRHLELHNEGPGSVVDALEAILPNLKRVWVGEGGSYRWINLKVGNDTFLLEEMSHGTIRGLILALLLHTPERMSLLALDEPELNLHPAWMQIVGRWLLRCRSADQVFVSTHSPDLLDVFTESFREGDVKVLVFERGDGGVRAVDPASLDTFFKEGWELGDLYRVGERQLGGWPW